MSTAMKNLSRLACCRGLSLEKPFHTAMYLDLVSGNCAKLMQRYIPAPDVHAFLTSLERSIEKYGVLVYCHQPVFIFSPGWVYDQNNSCIAVVLKRCGM